MRARSWGYGTMTVAPSGMAEGRGLARVNGPDPWGTVIAAPLFVPAWTVDLLVRTIAAAGLAALWIVDIWHPGIDVVCNARGLHKPSGQP